MKTLTNCAACLAVLSVGIFTGCSQTPKSPEVASSIRRALDQAGLKKVSVAQDREKGVVTLSGNVGAEGEKAQADAVARSLAGGQVVADQIAVLPPGAEQQARAVNADLDKGIEQNLDAALIENRLHRDVKYSVKSGVVTLTGNVNSQEKRSEAANVARSVPNVQEVVNELQVKNQKASSPE